MTGTKSGDVMIPSEKNSSSAVKRDSAKSESGDKWVRRMAPIVVLCGGLGIALFAGSRVPRADDPSIAPPVADAPAANAPAAAVMVAEKPLTSEYQPSRFPGVMVRHIADAGAHARANARWVVPAGQKRHIPAGTSYNPPSATEINAVPLPSGGTRRNVPAALKMAEGVRLVNGHLVPIGMHTKTVDDKSAR